MHLHKDHCIGIAVDCVSSQREANKRAGNRAVARMRQEGAERFRQISKPVMEAGR